MNSAIPTPCRLLLLGVILSLAGELMGQPTISQQGAPTYTPGGTYSVTSTFSYTGQLLSLLWRPQLPTGWIVQSASGNGSVELNQNQGEVIWIGTIPASPIQLTYTVLVPAGQSGSKPIRGQVEYQFSGSVNPVTAYALPDPLMVTSAIVVDIAILTHPQSLSVNAGATVTFNVSATGSGTLSYQWQFNGSNLSGANSATLTLSNVATNQAGNYSVVVTDPTGSVTSNPAVLTVTGRAAQAPQISQQSPSTYSPGGVLTITNTFAYSGQLLSLLWRPQLPNGWTVQSASGSGSVELNQGEVIWIGTIPASPILMIYTVVVPVGDSGSKQIRGQVEYQLAGTVNPTTGYAAPDPLAVAAGGTAPQITQQPQSQSVFTGGSASFSVAASGSPAPTFQWQLSVDGGATWSNFSNVSPYSGTTSSSLSVNGVTSSMNNYEFRVVASNGLGSNAVCTPAILTVRPSFTVYSADATTTPSGTTRLYLNTAETQVAPNGSLLWFVADTTGAGIASITGNVPLSTLQAIANDVPSLQLVASGVTPGSLGGFAAPGTTTFTFANIDTGYTNDNIYALLFNDANRNGAPDAGETFGVSKIGVAPLPPLGNAQWLISQNIHADQNTIIFAPLTNSAPVVSSQPQSVSCLVGATVSFSAVATGVPPPNYQWLFNGVPIPGATNGSLSLPNVQAGQAGQYSVVVKNTVGSATSAVATLTINIPPSITAGPLSQTVAVGSHVTFTVLAASTTPPDYQWSFNGNLIPGATNASLSLINVQSNQAGNYSAVVTNPAGRATSAVATLTINTPPSITAGPASQTVAVGSNVTLTFQASGTQPFAYQWFFNGSPVPGATNGSLSLSNVQTSQAGQYSVVVTNSVGSTTSPAATLAVVTSLHHFTISSVGSPQTAGLPFTITIMAQDANNNLVADFRGPISISSSNAGVVSPSVSGAFTAGQWSGSVTVTNAGLGKVIAVKDAGGVSGNSNPFAVDGGPAATLKVSPTYTNMLAGTFNPLTVTAYDAFGNVATSYQGMHVLSFDGLSNIGTYRDNVNGSFQLATATFTDGASAGALSFQGFRTRQAVLRVTDGPHDSYLGGTNNANNAVFTVAPNVPNTLAFVQPPTDTQAGLPITPPVSVQVVDQYGNAVAPVPEVVVTISKSFGNGSLRGTTSVATTAGLALLPDLSVDVAGFVKLLAQCPPLTPVESGFFQILPSALDHFALSAIGTQTAGTPFSITITAQDRNNNTIISFTGTVNLGLSPSGAGTISPTATSAFVAGTWTGNVRLTNAATAVAIVATNIAGAQTGTSGSFSVVVAGTPTKYIVTASDYTPLPGATITASAQLADSSGNPIKSAGRLVNWSSTGGGSFAGSPTQTDANGVAAVSFTVSTQSGTAHTVTASTILVGTGSFVGTSAEIVTTAANVRVVRMGNATAVAGGIVNVPITLDAQGDEGGMSFTFTFDPTILSLEQVTKGAGVPGGLLITNTTQIASGRLGILLSTPIGTAFSAGTQELVVASFNVLSGVGATNTTIGFADQPIRRQVVRANSDVFPTNLVSFVEGSVRISAQPSAVSSLPAQFTPGRPFTVNITVTPPTGTSLYLVQDQPPAGWSVSGISDQGSLKSGKVNWLFADDQARTLSYIVTPPADAVGTFHFVGQASFDGVRVVSVTGMRDTINPITPPAPIQLSATLIKSLDEPLIKLTLTGQDGKTYRIEVAHGLEPGVQWQTRTTITLGGSAQTWIDPALLVEPRRFYRAVLLP